MMAISFCASYSLGGGSKYDSFQIDVSVFRTKYWGVSSVDEVEGWGISGGDCQDQSNHWTAVESTNHDA